MTTQTKTHRTRMAITASRAEEDGSYEITIAANGEARDMYDLELSSLRMENYLRNPVVMWSHDRYDLPIGRTLSITRDKGAVKARFEFLPDDEKASRVKNAWDKGFIRAASVSWGGGDITFLDNGKIRESNAELYEWSLVSVPADPDALRNAERALNLPEGVLMKRQEEEETPEEEEETTVEDRLAVIEGQIADLDAAFTELAAKVNGEEEEGDESVSEEADLRAAKRELDELMAYLEEKA